MIKSSQGLREIWRSEVDEVERPIGSGQVLYTFSDTLRDIISLVVITKFISCRRRAGSPCAPNCPPDCTRRKQQQKVKGMREAVVSSDQNHVSQTQGKLPLWTRSSYFHRPVQYPGAVSTLRVPHLPQGRRYRRFGRSWGARAHARRQGTNLV